MSGTHKGDFPGIPATGKRFSSVRGSTILELEAGKIRRQSDYWDAATFMRQVGLLEVRTMPTLQKPIGSGFGAASTASDVIKGIDLSDRVAIVTGGYSGIGLETTRALR